MSAWLLFELAISLLEAGLDIYLFNHLLSPKRKGASLNAAIMLTVSAYVVWLGLCGRFKIAYLIDYGVLSLICFVYNMTTREGHWLLKLFWPLFSGALLWSIDVLTTQCLTLMLHVPLDAFYSFTSDRVLSVVVIHILYIVFIHFIITWVSHKQNRINIGSIAIVLLTLSSVGVLLMIEYIQTLIPYSQWEGISIVASLTAFAINILALRLFYHLTNQQEELDRLKQEAYLTDMKLRHQGELRVIYEQIAAWKHDAHNHYQAISGAVNAGDISKAQAYMEEIAAEEALSNRIFCTTNVMLDALLGSKVCIAQKSDIDTEVRAMLPDNLPITDSQLCILIGNLLDNSIEACEKIVAGEKRIVLSILPMKENLQISVFNTTSGRPKVANKQLISTKNHVSVSGIGLRSVDSIVAQAGGYCERSYDDRSFTTSILIPVKRL